MEEKLTKFFDLSVKVSTQRSSALNEEIFEVSSQSLVVNSSPPFVDNHLSNGFINSTNGTVNKADFLENEVEIDKDSMVSISSVDMEISFPFVIEQDKISSEDAAEGS